MWDVVSQMARYHTQLTCAGLAVQWCRTNFMTHYLFQKILLTVSGDWSAWVERPTVAATPAPGWGSNQKQRNYHHGPSKHHQLSARADCQIHTLQSMCEMSVFARSVPVWMTYSQRPLLLPFKRGPASAAIDLKTIPFPPVTIMCCWIWNKSHIGADNWHLWRHPTHSETLWDS